MTDVLRAHPETPDPTTLTTRAAFSEALTQLRDQLGLPRRKLAKKVSAGSHYKISHTTIEHWFKGGLPQQGSEDTFKRLLRELNVAEDMIDQWLTTVRRLRLVRRSFGMEPYRGLNSFDVDDADWFFARNELTGEVLDRLNELHRSGGGVVMVVGASGAGKSSLLKAGVIPALARGRLPNSARWRIVVLTPAQRPLDQLAKIFAEHLDADAQEIATSLRADPSRAADYTRQLINSGTESETGDVPVGDGTDGSVPSRRLVLIVDQFEQTFVTRDHEEDADGVDQEPEIAARSFVAALSAAATGPHAALVIVGLRADFYPAILDYPQLLAAARHPINVGPMTDDQLREVITEPAHKANLRVSPEFVDLLLSDISRSGRAAHGAGVLPLLSHALHVTWLHGEGRELTRENYRAIGGIDGAVARSAEVVYNRLTVHQQSLARRLFVGLVHVHADAADTRRRVPHGQLLDELVGDGDIAELDEVLEQFITERLITMDMDTVEITHDALITAWPIFREWLDTDRAGLLLTQQLTQAARDWDQHHREQARLYQGTPLAAARTWASEHGNDLPDIALEFLEASGRYARRRTRRLYQTIGALGLLLVLTVSLGVVAWQQRANAVDQRATAERERDDAMSRMMATRANELRATDVSLARQLSLVAYRIAPTVEARSTLLDASAVRPAIRMRGGDDVGIMPAVAFHPTGTTIAAAAEATVRLWDVAEPGHPRPMQQLPTAPDAKIYAMAFSPDGQLLATACADGAVRMWDTRSPGAPVPLSPLTGLGGKVYSAVFSPDGQMLATAGADADGTHGTVRLWKVGADRQVSALGEPVRIDGSAAKSVSFHASNRFLAVGTEGGAVQIWDIGDPALPDVVAIPTGPTKAIGQLAFSPDGRMLAAGSADFAAYLWNVEELHSPRPMKPITGVTSWINAVAFSPDSASLAIASSDAELGVRIFELATMRITATLPHPAPATAVKFSPNGQALVTGANDGTARLWPLAAPTLNGMIYPVSATRFSSDGRTLAVGSAETQLWNVTDPHHPTPHGPPLTNPDSFNGTLAFAPDGHTLAAGHGRSGALQLWDITDPGHPTPHGPPLAAHQQQIETVQFSPNGRLLATGARDKTLHLWDVNTPTSPRRLATLTGFGSTVSWAAFSPIGQILVAASFDKTIRIWNIADPTHPVPVGTPFKPANHYVYSAVFSPNGQTLAVSSADSTVRLYDITDPAQPRQLGAPLTGPTNYVYAVSFNTTGTTLAAAATDSTVWLWDLHQRDSPTPIATLTLPTDAVYTLDFRPHSDILAAGAASNTAWVWHTDPEQAATHICVTTGDPITPAEWAKYVPGRDYQPPCSGK